MDPQKSDSKKRECSPPKDDFSERKKMKLSEIEDQLKIQTETLKGISLEDDGSKGQKSVPEKNINVDTIYDEEYLTFQEAKTYLSKGDVGSGFYVTRKMKKFLDSIE